MTCLSVGGESEGVSVQPLAGCPHHQLAQCCCYVDGRPLREAGREGEGINVRVLVLVVIITNFFMQFKGYLLT